MKPYLFSDKENIMANKSKDFVIRGTIDWCKLLGKARPYTGDPRYDKGPSWSVEINPDEKSRQTIAALGLNDKFKRDKKTKKDGSPTKNCRDYDFLRFTILENRPDGTKNKPAEITDASGAPWNPETEMGNGTTVDILAKFTDYGTTQGLYFRKMRVLKHVPFEGGGTDFEPLSEDDEFFAGGADSPAEYDGSPSSQNPDDLDDDIPF